VRRGLTALAGLVLASLGCASAAPPPGGPEDHAPPRLVRVTPDTNAVNVDARHVSFYFDETINDRGSGAQEVGSFFLVSPSNGSADVSWHRSRIDVRPHEGFRANTAYTVTLLPGLSDLRNNVMRAGASVVFSTGPTIPTGQIAGTAFDWLAERPAVHALVQAVTPDSVTYLAQSDSVGHFVVGPLPPGSYLVRAIVDQNNNRALDRNEPFDSLRVTVPQRAPAELRTIARDTLPPRILSVAVSDSVTLRVTFDRYLDPTSPPGAAAFRLVGADSAAVPVTAALTPREEQRQAQAATQARVDSARRADSLAGKPIPPRPAAPATPTPTPAAAAPTPSIPAPPNSLLLRLGRPLAPSASYRLSVTGARALNGRLGNSERSFATPRPAPPRPAADSARRPARPAVPPGRPPSATPPTRRP
jgi:hypothetical protein